MAHAPVVLTEISDRIATLTLHRPESRNALNRRLLAELWTAVESLGADPEVDVIVLTGSDPAFCAGVDLKELSSPNDDEPSPEGRSAPNAEDNWAPFRFFPAVDKPLIAAVNGAAVTAGLELALQCTLLVASERARFADTHSRVGIMPGGGMTVLLAAAVGHRLATELSLTGNYLSADDALRAGLVNRVVPHEQLLPTARALAADMASNDREAVRRLLLHYRSMADAATQQEAFEIEAALTPRGRAPTIAAGRRDNVFERGRRQTSP